jgi:hypothetical protein
MQYTDCREAYQGTRAAAQSDVPVVNGIISSTCALRLNSIRTDRTRTSVFGQRDLVAFAVEVNLVHESSNQKQPSAANRIEVGRVRRVRQAARIESRPLIGNREIGASGR